MTVKKTGRCILCPRDSKLILTYDKCLTVDGLMLSIFKTQPNTSRRMDCNVHFLA